MEKNIDNNRVQLYPSDWRWSASIVGLIKYFDYNGLDYVITDDYLEFELSLINEERYFLFVENHFKDLMHHKKLENLLEINEPTEEQVKVINDILKMNIKIIKNFFKGYKYNGNNKEELKNQIVNNRMELIKGTYKTGKSLYSNFCNERKIFTDRGDCCRIKGYSIDTSRKIGSQSFMANTEKFVSTDYLYFDFIPFAFSKINSKIHEAFFINNNFTIDQLIKTNKTDPMNDEKSMQSKLFFKIKNSSNFIDYDVEVIKKEREKDYFETIFVRREAVKVLEKINGKTLEAVTNPCKVKKAFAEVNKDSKGNNYRDKDSMYRLKLEKIVIDCILNNIKLDFLIDGFLKEYERNYIISELIKINELIYGEEKYMTEKQGAVINSAKEVKKVLKGKQNKIRAYEQRLISAITLKDYDKVQEILLHLSAFTQVRMDFLIDLFEDFETNKNLAYTFINTLGEKKNK
ncbi:type I CRISPR-associated protein Cas8a1/Csx8 [uncultured Ilyobacter sp.]|uniref:type I CRISPR-associated protein Cas8a1/Csx8 n=1 Tax=uncultured Ilyobacter sp. TaxID=544433 RepID=UPI0029F494E7|nr:type I CRISPR-associated protein Cas8a1/Csx8 [uncultured Ilyobacter sp.]